VLAGLLADLVLVIHLGFIAFAVFGALLVMRWRRAALLHLPALAWAAWIELSSGICPLTPIENALRRSAGESGYAGSFIAHYLVPLIYPPGLASHEQLWLAAGLLAINLVLYGCVAMRHFSPGRPVD
jgi:hypothetical protein